MVVVFSPLCYVGSRLSWNILHGMRRKLCLWGELPGPFWLLDSVLTSRSIRFMLCKGHLDILDITKCKWISISLFWHIALAIGAERMLSETIIARSSRSVPMPRMLWSTNYRVRCKNCLLSSYFASLQLDILWFYSLSNWTHYWTSWQYMHLSCLPAASTPSHSSSPSHNIRHTWSECTRPPAVRIDFNFTALLRLLSL